MTRQVGWRNDQKSLAESTAPSEAGPSSLSEWITRIWLVGMLVLLPMDFIKLPLGVTLVDLWVLIGLPIFWLSFIRGKQIISLSYAIPMWLILVASFISTFAAPAPKNSLIVILKEVYAYIWFVTLTAVLATLNARERRRILIVWSGVVLLHGFIIVAQFLSPAFWQFITSLGARSSDHDIYRPSGLSMNANSAAFFQLLGFVPLMLVSPSKNMAILLGALLFPTMLLTGSMGATLSFVIGMAVAVTAIALSGHLVLMIRIFVRLGIALSLLGSVAYFIINHNERYHDHFEQIFLGRAEKSSGGRFDLWQRGYDAYVDNKVFLWGVGPENFREVDPTERDNQLHNDFLAFSVERGLLGTLGLVLFVVVAAGRASYMILIAHRHPDRASLAVVVFLAAIVATVVNSQAHQMFHFRELWVVLALQEATLFQMTRSAGGVVPAPRAQKGSPRQPHGFIGQPDISRG